MSGLSVEEAARALGVKVGTLRRWVREGAPCVARGRRGRGCALLVDVDAVRAWRGSDVTDAVVLELAGALPQVLANAMAASHQRTEGPHKRAAAGMLAATWYVGTAALLDHLRQRCPAVPEIEVLPDEIERLQKIAKGV